MKSGTWSIATDPDGPRSPKRLLSDIGGGATVLPPCEGAWLNPETGTLIRENVVLAYTYVDPYRFGALLGRIRRFMHRLGRETGQGEVVLEFSGRLYKIRHFDCVCRRNL